MTCMCARNSKKQTLELESLNMKTAITRTAIILLSFSLATLVFTQVGDLKISEMTLMDGMIALAAVLVSVPGVIAMFSFSKEKSPALKDRLIDVAPTVVGCSLLILALALLGALHKLLLALWFVIGFSLLVAQGSPIKSRSVNSPEK